MSGERDRRDLREALGGAGRMLAGDASMLMLRVVGAALALVETKPAQGNGDWVVVRAREYSALEGRVDALVDWLGRVEDGLGRYEG